MGDYKLDAPGYFNTSGCIYYGCMTNIEIEGSKIRLGYWKNKDNTRKLILDEMDINEILNRTFMTTEINCIP